MWASELADEAPGVRLTLCKGCGLPAMSEDHCTAEEFERRSLRSYDVPAKPSRTVVNFLVREGGRAHYKKLARAMRVDERYVNNVLCKLHREGKCGIVRVSRGVYAYLPPELRRDQPS